MYIVVPMCCAEFEKKTMHIKLLVIFLIFFSFDVESDFKMTITLRRNKT